MTDGCVRSAGDRHQEPNPEPAEVAAALPDLLDAALNEADLESTLHGVVRWWAKRLPAARIAIGMQSERSDGLVAIADGSGATGVETVPSCRLHSRASWRDVVCRRLASDSEAAWSPLADRGRILGGMALAVTSGVVAPPPLWIDVTARLLADAARRDLRRRDEKLAALAEFAAGAGHEINNPLGTILGRVQLLSRDEPHPDRQRLLATIGAQALRVRDMIGDVMLFARPPHPQLQRLRWSTVVDAALRAVTTEWERRRITLCGERDDAICIAADPAQAAVVVCELLRNATRAAPDGSSIEVGLQAAASDVSTATLHVADRGGGLSPTDLRHLFDPFYSGRQAGRGLGFGLSKCWRIVTQHGGCLHAENLHPGVRMTVHWPLA